MNKIKYFDTFITLSMLFLFAYPSNYMLSLILLLTLTKPSSANFFENCIKVDETDNSVCKKCAKNYDLIKSMVCVLIVRYFHNN